MSKEIISKFHWFMSWQDEKQEGWLGEMSRMGVHLKEARRLGRFLFLAGPEKEYAYRMDFNKDKPTEEYLLLIQDAGLEYLGKNTGWHYWRKEIINGQVPELFTDRDSKIAKYQRLLAFYSTSAPAAGVMYIFGAAVFKQFPGRHPLAIVVLYLSLFMAWLLFAGLNAIMILIRIEAIKKLRTL